MEIANQLRNNIEEIAKAAHYLITVTTKNPLAASILKDPKEEKALVDCSIRFCKTLTELVKQPPFKDRVNVARLKELGAKVVNLLRDFIPLGLKAILAIEDMVQFVSYARTFRDVIQELRQMASKLSSEFIAKESISHLGKQFYKSIERASRAISSVELSQEFEPRKPPVYVTEVKENSRKSEEYSPALNSTTEPINPEQIQNIENNNINTAQIPAAAGNPLSPRESSLPNLNSKSAGSQNSKSDIATGTNTARSDSAGSQSNKSESTGNLIKSENVVKHNKSDSAGTHSNRSDSAGNHNKSEITGDHNKSKSAGSNSNRNKLKKTNSTHGRDEIPNFSLPNNNLNSDEKIISNNIPNGSTEDSPGNVPESDHQKLDRPTFQTSQELIDSIIERKELPLLPALPITPNSLKDKIDKNRNSLENIISSPPGRPKPIRISGTEYEETIKSLVSDEANDNFRSIKSLPENLSLKSAISENTFELLVKFTEKLGNCFTILGTALESESLEDIKRCVYSISEKSSKLLEILSGLHQELSQDPGLCKELWDMISRFEKCYLHFYSTSSHCIENFSNSSFQLQFSAATRSFGTSLDELLEFLFNQKSRLNLYNYQDSVFNEKWSSSPRWNSVSNPNKVTKNRTEKEEMMGRARSKLTFPRIKHSGSSSLFNTSIPDLWSSRTDNVIYEENPVYIKFASLNRLVVELTHPDRGDIQFMKTFISTYHSFTSPYELMHLLAARYNVPTEENLPMDQVKAIQLRVINTIKFWLKTQCDDFSPESIELVRDMISRLQLDGHAAHKSLTQILESNLNKAVTNNERSISRDDSFWIHRRDPVDLIFEVPVDVLALHIAMIEFDIFKKLKPSELMNSAWTKPKTKHQSPHIIQLISRFNAVSYWVASLILWQEKLQDRVKVISKFIELAVALEKISSYNSLLEILAGLNNASVRRLRISYGELSRKHINTLDRLNEKMNPYQNYSQYRKVLRECVMPCLPYLGVYLTDLIFIEEANQDTNPSGLINFKKRRKMYTVIEEIQTYQMESYVIQDFKLPVMVYLTAIPFNDEDELYRISLTREPRGVESKNSVL